MKRSFRSIFQGVSALMLLGITSLVMASTPDTSDVFYEFMETVQGWATGPLGIGLALLMLLIGAGFGVARNSPLPALSGIAAAALLHWGPTVIINLMTGGALI